MDARRPSPRPTEDGGATQRVAPKGEDVGVISRHHSQGVGGGGELACPRHCPIQHDSLHQRLLGPAAVVAMVDPAACTGNVAITLSLVPWDAHPLPGPAAHHSPSHAARLGLLIFHKEKEAVGVPAQDANGLFCHLHDGGVRGGVAVQLVLQVLGLEEAWGSGVGSVLGLLCAPASTPGAGRRRRRRCWWGRQ